MTNSVKTITFWLIFEFLILKANSLFNHGLNHLPKDYVVKGDIHIGYISYATALDEEKNECFSSNEILSWQIVEAMVFAVEKLNQNKTILPGVKLGITVADSCRNTQVAQAQADRFKPANTNNAPNDPFGVVAVVVVGSSSIAKMVSQILNHKYIPQIGISSSSDELSDKTQFPYFFRVISGDRIQVKVVVQFMKQQNWTYFSVIYTENSYGTYAMKALEDYLIEFDMCVSNIFTIGKHFSSIEYRRIVSQLIDDNDRARVVFAIIDGNQLNSVLQALHEVGGLGKIIIIGMDGVFNNLLGVNDNLEKYTYGIFASSFHAPPNEPFRKYLNTIKLLESKNIFLQGIWEMEHECSIAMGTCNGNKNVMESMGNETSMYVDYMIDAVTAIAMSLEAIRKEHCLGLPNDKAAECIVSKTQQSVDIVYCHSIAQHNAECVTTTMIDQLRKVSFAGITGMVHFDEDGDRFSSYEIYQRLPGQLKVIQKMTVDTGGIEASEVGVATWEYVEKPKIHRHNRNTSNGNLPTSACFVCCKLNERIVDLNASCCTRLLDCPLESKKKDRIYCEQCNDFEWPDFGSHYSLCSAIKGHLNSAIAYIIFSLSGVGTMMSLGVLFTIIVQRKALLIQLWNRELSILIIIAILTGFLSNMIYFLPSVKLVCAFLAYSRPISTTGLYVPILLKTIRMHYMYGESTKGRKAMKLFSPLPQMLIALASIGVQIVIQIFLASIDPIEIVPTHGQGFTLNCDFKTPANIIYHTINVLVIIISTYFAYKNRNLPASHGELHYTQLLFFVVTIGFYSNELLIMFTVDKHRERTMVECVLRLVYYSCAMFFLFYFRLLHLYKILKPKFPKWDAHSMHLTSVYLDSDANNLAPGGSPFKDQTSRKVPQ